MSRVVLNSAYLDKFINYASQHQEGDVEDVKRPKSRVAFGVLTQVKKYRHPYLKFSIYQEYTRFLSKYSIFGNSTDFSLQIFIVYQEYKLRTQKFSI